MELFGEDLELETYVLYLCRLIFSFCGIFLNLSNIVVICVASRKSSPMCRLVINLAIADMSVCVCDILSAAKNLLIWAFKMCAKSVYIFLQISSFLATLLAVIFIAINNYLMILKPLQYGAIITATRVSRTAVVMWILVLLFSSVLIILPVFIQPESALMQYFESEIKHTYGYSDYQNSTLVSVFTDSNSTHNDSSVLSHGNSFFRFKENNTETSGSYTVYMGRLLSYMNSTRLSWVCFQMNHNLMFNPYLIFAAGTFIGLLILIFTYCRICCEIRNLSDRSHRMTGHSVSQRKSSIITFLIVLSFLLCWMPGALVVTVTSFLNKHTFVNYEPTMWNTLFILQVVNTIIDPVLYAFRLQEVRVCYHDVFKACLK